MQKNNKPSRQITTYLIRDIVFVLIFKILLLTLLWYVCFSKPILKQDQLKLVKENIFNLKDPQHG